MTHLFTVSILVTLSLICNSAFSQNIDSIYNKAFNFPDNLLHSINKKSVKFQDQLDKQTDKYLKKLQRHEKRLERKLQKKDSAAARELFGDVNARYSALNKIKDGNAIPGQFRNLYSRNMDSVKTALQFLSQNNMLNQNSEEFETLMKQYNSLQEKLNQTEQIRKYLKQRQQWLKAHLEKFGLTKQFRKFQKDIYYYRAQVDEYKQILEDPSKMEAKVLEVARKIPAFKNFFAKYSELGRLFPMQGNDPMNYAANLTGLQTRAMVQQNIQNRLGSGPNITQAIQQNVQSAQSQLSQLKDKIEKMGSSSNDLDIPNFRPNNQRVKNFWQRIEVGTNLQTGKSNSFFPATSDLGLSVGYKLTDKSIIGIGASYKMGWGQNIRNLKITQEGVGLRSFLDWKIKASFYASGGFEYNYQKAFNSMAQLYVFDDWQQSGLLGVSKVVSLNSKFFKKTKVQMLWDFLSYRQRPAGQPIKFRIGYNF